MKKWGYVPCNLGAMQHSLHSRKGDILASGDSFTVIFWERISDAMFFALLLPLITAGTNLALVILGLTLTLAYLKRRIHRRW